MASSWKLSMTTKPTPPARAYSSSARVLLLPWKKIFSGGKPATLATWYSPPEETSMERPSSSTNWAIATAENALLA